MSKFSIRLSVLDGHIIAQCTSSNKILSYFAQIYRLYLGLLVNKVNACLFVSMSILAHNAHIVLS